jgi:hypothetical protein
MKNIHKILSSKNSFLNLNFHKSNKVFTINQYNSFVNDKFLQKNFCNINKSNNEEIFDENEDSLSTKNLQRKLNNLYRFQESQNKLKENKNSNKKKNKDNKNSEDSEKSSDEHDENSNENLNEKNEKKVKKVQEDSTIKKLFKGFVKLWNDTFPREIDYENVMITKMKEAQVLKDKIIYAKDEEEIEALQSEVPEWKRTAVILLVDNINSKNENKESIIQYYSKMIEGKIVTSETFNKLKTTDTYKEYEQFKDDLGVIKGNIKDNIAMSYNPAVIVAKDLFVSFKF